MATLAELQDALTNADAAGDTAAATALADEIVRMQGQPQEQAPAQQPVDSPERRALVEQLRQRIGASDAAGKKLQSTETAVGLARPFLRGAVDLADGVTALPRLLASAPVAGFNAVTGRNVPLPITASVADVADEARGLFSQRAGQIPSARQRLAPQNDTEQLSSTITQGLGGVLGGFGLGGVLGAGAGGASSTAVNVGNALVANPALQIAGAVTGGTSAELARRGGAGPIGQFAANLAGSMIPGAALSGANKLATGVTRTPEAQRLLDRGVDLTPGQLNPPGLQNQLEESLQSVGGVGPPIAAARGNARTTFQQAAIQEGAAPGTAISQADPADMLAQAYRSFEPLYDQAKGFPVSANIVNQGQNVPLSTALRQAVRNRGILATDDQRKTVLAYLKDQLTKGVNTSDDLLNIRSSIRDKARAAAKAQGKEEQAELLSAADDVITQALESQLPQKALTALRTADGKYSDYKVIESAVARSKDRVGGFTPNDLSEAIAQASAGARGSYARGGGGALRELASDARAVLDARSPPTGARLLAAAIPGGALAYIDPVTGAVVTGGGALGSLAAATTQTGRRLAAGTTGPQQALRGAINRGFPDVPLAVRQQAISGALRQPSQLSPTAQIVRDMIGIPSGAPQSPFLGLQPEQEEQLRAGLYR